MQKIRAEGKKTDKKLVKKLTRSQRKERAGWPNRRKRGFRGKIEKEGLGD